MNQLNVLIIDSVHPIMMDRLLDGGINCDYQPDISENKIHEIIAEYDGIILRSKIKIDKDFLLKAAKLKFIGRVGAGLENIDIESAEKFGIKCYNSPEGNRDAVGEHALGMLLAVANNMVRANSEVRSGKWLREENRGFEIKGKTIGIIGYGNMGGAFARKLKGFEANVIAYDKYKFDYSDDFVKENSLEQLFEATDILSLHVPLTDETHYMINDEFINRFKKNIYIINTARGKVVKTDELVKNLKSGKVKAAMLDVLEFEKLSFEGLSSEKNETLSYLLNSENVLLSPHVGGWTHESKIKLSEIIAEKVLTDFA